MGQWRKQQLTVFLNNKCNLSCVYCCPGDYKRSDAKIDLDFAKAGIDLYVGQQGYKWLRLFAPGEPTLSFVEMRELTAYAKMVNPAIKIELQTNLACNPVIVDWIARNVDMLWVSLDGPAEVQNSQRPFVDGSPTYALVESNMMRLKGMAGTVGIRPTITPATLHRMPELLNHVHNLGFRTMFFHYMIEQQGQNKRSQEDTFFGVNLLEFAKEYVKVYHLAQDLDMFVGNFLTMNFDEPVQWYCGACLSAPHLTLDGYVTSCDKSPYGADERFAKFVVGKWDGAKIESVPANIAVLRARKVDNMTGCSECSVRHSCGGGCLGEANYLFGDWDKVMPQYCEAIKYLLQHLPKPKQMYDFCHP